MSVSPRIGDIAIGVISEDDRHYEIRGTVLAADPIMGKPHHPYICIVGNDGDEGYFFSDEVTVLHRPGTDPVTSVPEEDTVGVTCYEGQAESHDINTGHPLGTPTMDELHALAENPKDRLGVKKAALRLVPQALRILAVPAMQLGAEKYGPMNWRTKAVKMSVYLEAAQRHLAAFEDGEDNDAESGASHLSHAAACLGIIADAQALGQLEDDRMTPGPAASMMAALDRSKEG